MDRNRAVARLLVGLCFPSAVIACGARSSLPACTDPGAIRACDNACGPGSQACVDDRWGPCNVPVATRSCSNDCGQGTQTCAAGAWSVCAVPQAVRTCSSRCGPGQEQCLDGGWQPCDAPQPGPPTITATVRDFNDTHPDFESDAAAGPEPGILAPDLGPDDKPVYVAGAGRSTHGAAYFHDWYHDTPDAGALPDGGLPPDGHLTTTVSLSFAPATGSPSTYAYDNEAFFPIDGRLLGNQGRIHNYDFTLELATTFQYTGGEIFRFASDDDSWVFLNKRLAVDLGGIHQASSGFVNLDLQSQQLGMVKGGTYPIHVFYAERHVIGAVLHIDVAAADFAVCAASMP